MSQLKLRLKNCIQTILELEKGIRENRPEVFDSDFITLKNFLEQIDHITLVEEDVTQLENITVQFLTALSKNTIWKKTCNILQ